MKITLKQLRLIGACEPQVELFKATFGTEVELTEANAVQYGALFDIDWLASELLKGDKLADYRAKRDTLYADYEAKRDALDADYWAKGDPSDADYKAKRDALFADYRAKRYTLDADYEAKRYPLDADCEAKRDALDADYKAKRATAFVELVSL
jgi:hypothetical protein